MIQRKLRIKILQALQMTIWYIFLLKKLGKSHRSQDTSISYYNYNQLNLTLF